VTERPPGSSPAAGASALGAPPRGFGDLTEPLPGSAAPRAPLGVVVRVVGAEATPAVIKIGPSGCVVGSAPGCDVVIADKAVSRNHLELGLAPEGVRVRDLGSRNGTFFHGQRVEKMVLSLGGQLTVGSASLHFEADTEALWSAGASAAARVQDGEYRGIVGTSAAMRQLFGMLARLEGSLATVLIEGESGVGKERVARALHDGSKVQGGPLVAINCGAFPRELIASELFGHRRGAFSGAFDARRGAFESADGGTLFLDEVGELPLELQPMLLRALELGEVRALGDDVPRQVKVRIIAATNRDLEADVRAGKFRQDLFYRLAVVRLRVPPLAERPEDIEPLARLFAREAGLPGGLSPEIVSDLRARRWAGNARELRNAIVSYAALGALPARPAKVQAELEALLAELVDPDRPFSIQKDELSDAFGKSYLRALMAKTGGNQSEAARISGLNRSYLGRMLARYGLSAKGR
jgi:DNA-binding NtrC family response regulator